MNRHAAIARSALLLCAAFLSSCAALEPASSRAEIVAGYYRSVDADRAPSIREFRRRLASETALVEPIGWTVSGTPFANVISGRWERETRVVDEPRRFAMPGRRHGRIEIEVIRIRDLDLPEYFEFTGEPRAGFASAASDRIFLDHRRETDPRILEEAFEHETAHLLDRPLFATLAPEDLEIRAMIRGLSRGSIPLVNRERLYFALGHPSPQYRNAAARLLEALALAAVGVPDPSALRDIEGPAIAAAARALETVLGL